MSNLDFELDINKYTSTELQTLFSLSKSFTSDDIEDQRDILQKKIMTDENLDEEKRGKVINFLNEANNKLNRILLTQKNRSDG